MSENKVPGKRYPAINDCNQTVMYDLGLDTIDIAILNWIAQFAASSHTNTLKQPDGMIYHWISYSKAQTDLFALRFNSKETFKYRLNKLCGENGDSSKKWPLKKHLDSTEKGNSKTYFALTVGYDELHTWKTYEELPEPEPEKDEQVLSEDFIDLYSIIQENSPFKKSLYKKDGATPLKEFFLCQKMIESLLKGTFIEDWHVKIGKNQNPECLKGMTKKKIIQICSRAPSGSDSLRNFFVRCYEPSKNSSGFLKVACTVPSNCNATTPNVTTQKDGTIPESVQLSLKTLKSCPKFKPHDEKKLLSNLIFLDSWIKQEYSWVEEYNNGKHRDMYNTLPNMMEWFVYIMNHWESRSSFDESFVEHGKWGWSIYVKKCQEEGIELELGPMSKKNIEAERKRKQMQAELDKEKKNGQENR